MPAPTSILAIASSAPPRTLTAARAQASKIIKGAEYPAGLRAALAAAIEKTRTLSDVNSVISRTLITHGAQKGNFKNAWSKYIPAAYGNSARRGDAAVTSRISQVGGFVALPPGIARETPPPHLTAGELAVVESQGVATRIEAEKAARFQKNWGSGRAAEDAAHLATYMGLELGSKERSDYFARWSESLWRAAKKVERAYSPASK